MKLVLPLPPSPNRSRGRWALYRAKRAYQRECWLAACGQELPPHTPPAHVRVKAARYYAKHPQDDDNAVASLKWPLDALKQLQRGKLDWRQGVCPTRGFFVDDDPGHLTLLGVEQVKVNRIVDERLELIIIKEAA